MPKIAQYEGTQVHSDLTRSPNAPMLPSSSFGDPGITAALKLTEIAAGIKQRVDTTSAEEATVKFERDKNDLFFNPDKGYFNTQGKTAYDNSPEVSKALEELKIKHGESLGSNSRSIFNKVIDKHITNAQMEISRHAAKGLKAWEVSTLEAQVENSIENASLYYNDHDKLKVQNVLGRQSIIDSSKMLGISEEATSEKLQTFESSFAKATIEAATQSSATDGKLSFEKYSDRLEGPDKVKMQDLIERKSLVEKTRDDARAATLTATKLVSQYDSKADIIAEVNKIEDPELRKKTMTESVVQYERKKSSDKEIQNDYYNKGIEHFNKGGTAHEFQVNNPEAWEGMSATQRNNLLAGKHMTTDQVKFNSVISLPRSELVKVNPADYADSFKPADVAKLRTAVDKAKKGQTITSLQTPATKINSIAEQFYGKKTKWSGAKKEKVQSLMNAAQDAVEYAEEVKGGKLTPKEIDETLNQFSRKFVIERSAFGFDYLAPDLKIDISNTPPEKVAELSKFVNAHGEESFQKINELLKSKGKPVTIDTILNTYRQATQ